MQEERPGTQSDFMIEKIKERPVNKKKLIRRTITTAAMAVIFGLIACFTFLVLEPVISNWLYPEEEPQRVVFPEDPEEMSPEEMLSDNMQPELPFPGDPNGIYAALGEDQIQQILNKVTLDKDNYAQLYGALQSYIYDGDDITGNTCINQYMVIIRGISSNIDWFHNVQESDSWASGVIVANNGEEFLILVDYTPLKGADSLVLDLSDGYYQVPAQLKGWDPATNLAVVSVEIYSMPVEWLETGGLAVSPMGSSNPRNLVGTPVIAAGSPMGITDSIGYGIVSASTMFSVTDNNYKLIMTDIAGSRKASGALFNFRGELVGMITSGKTESDMDNVINAYGISELKKVVEKLSNGEKLCYMGISGTDVPSTVHHYMSVPYGAYVQKVEQNSPAMLAGIQQGDVIIAVEDHQIGTFTEYSNELLRMNPGQTVQFTVMRQVQEEYREMKFSIGLGEAK